MKTYLLRQYGDDPFCYVFHGGVKDGIWNISGRLLYREDQEEYPLLVGDATEWNPQENSICCHTIEPGTLFLYRGLPGSGKTTEALQLKDTLNAPLVSQGRRFFDALRVDLEKTLYSGFPFVIADGILSRKEQVKQLVGLAASKNYKTVVLYPNTSWREDPASCYEKSRSGFTAEEVRNFFSKWEW